MASSMKIPAKEGASIEDSVPLTVEELAEKHKREDEAAAAAARPKSATPELNLSNENHTAGIDAKSASDCTPVKIVLEKIDSSHSSVELKKNTKQQTRKRVHQNFHWPATFAT